MALTHTQSVSSHSILSTLIAPFAAIGRGLIYLAEQNQRYKQSMALHALTDDELAARGIKREDIFRVVYSSSTYN